MASHRAVLDYSNYTASFCRHGRQHTLTPWSILTDKGNFPGPAPESSLGLLLKPHLVRIGLLGIRVVLTKMPSTLVQEV